MGKISRYIAPLIFGGILFTGCSRPESTQSDSHSKKNIEQRVESVKPGKNSPSGWWKKEAPRRENYIEDFAGMNMEMVWIPGGIVYLPKGSLKHVEGFFIGKTEVSVKQFISFLEVSRYDPKTENVYITKSGAGSFLDYEDSSLPVTQISPKNAEYMAKYLSVRTGRDYSLPLLSEQILASFGPGFRWGGLPRDITPKNANIKWEDEGNVMPVKSLEPNRYGLYNIIGNVKEIAVVDQDPSEIKPGSGRGSRGIAWDGRMFTISSGWRNSKESFEKDYSGRDSAFDLITSDTVQIDYRARSDWGFRLVSRPKKED